jgi:hypothetical protein
MNDPEFQRAVAASLATEAYRELGGVHNVRGQSMSLNDQPSDRKTKGATLS